MINSQKRDRAVSLAREALKRSLRDPHAAGASKKKSAPINIASEDFGDLQRVVDLAWANKPSPYSSVSQMEFVVLAESQDLSDEVLEVVNLLPPGNYDRERLCAQLNSILAGHGWGLKLGTVE